MPEAEPGPESDIEPDGGPDAGLAADLALIRDAAREGGRIAMGFFRQDPEVWFKIGDSPVSAADFAVDRYLGETLRAARPLYGWLSEETADTPERLKARRTFVVDPIDGTRGFLAGRPTWCVSVAVVEKGRALAGVLDCPALGEVFTATAGGGALLNGAAIGVAAPQGPVRVTGPKAFLDRLGAIPSEPSWRAGIERLPHVPSLAYRLAMIAKGTLDATFVKPGAHDWDLAAAALILEEAGGRLLGVHGEAPAYAVSADPRHGPLVAAGSALAPAARAALGAWEEVERDG